jgi:hypothetical protein
MAKYASFTQDFGYIPDSNKDNVFNENFVSLFTISGNGIFLNGPTATLNSGAINFIWLCGSLQ